MCVALLVSHQAVQAADIYGYVDSSGTAHFAAEKLDERYRIFFRGGQSFDTAKGIGSPLLGGKVPHASQTLLALFEASPSYKTAKSALQAASSKHDIDYELLQALVATESGFNAQAVSPKGAVGLMQLMPATAQRYGVAADKRTTIEDKLFDPRINIAAGSRYLRDLIAMFPGQIELALAAYNAGEGAVQRAGNRIPNYRETQNYVQTVLQLYAYLKPGATSGSGGSGRAAVGGKSPGRVRMEMGGAIGRGNMPSGQQLQIPVLPTSPYMPDRPASTSALPPVPPAITE
ncbi:lytic transglycosylase domain-containing protein [Variovorax sp. RHLX14]|uniref:lytic transglycosylase domain-containing protein n=1 Tax=Variovorax sp. RHLX14 TaxID=1259731 RepID=UPI003F455557